MLADTTYRVNPFHVFRAPQMTVLGALVFPLKFPVGAVDAGDATPLSPAEDMPTVKSVVFVPER